MRRPLTAIAACAALAGTADRAAAAPPQPQLTLTAIEGFELEAFWIDNTSERPIDCIVQPGSAFTVRGAKNGMVLLDLIASDTTDGPGCEPGLRGIARMKDVGQLADREIGRSRDEIKAMVDERRMALRSELAGAIHDIAPSFGPTTMDERALRAGAPFTWADR